RGGSSRDDDVALDRIDLDALVLEPLHAALERPLIRLELERHPAVIGLHVGAPDVDHDVEVFYEPVHDRLLDQRRRKGHADAHAGPREPRASWPPAIAGTIATSSPSFSAVFLACRKRMSSWLT